MIIRILILSRFPIENAFSQRRTQPRQGLEAGERAALRRRRRREARRLRLLAAAPRDERVPGEAPLGAARNEQYIATSKVFRTALVTSAKFAKYRSCYEDSKESVSART